MREQWNDDELKGAVVAYLEMEEKERNGIPYVKKEYYEKLSQAYDRTSKSFEFRMQNISYVFYLLGRSFLPGLKPKQNVGTNTIQRIEKLINELEQKESFSTATFEASVVNFYKSGKKTPAPQGIKKPPTQVNRVSVFARDARVKAWVLKNSEGICELCRKRAPFFTIDEMPFLEIHHIKRLADGGTDSITNTVALCPNCHREIHYGLRSEEMKNKLYKEIYRLVRE